MVASVHLVQSLVGGMEEILPDLDVVALRVVECLHWWASWQPMDIPKPVVPEAYGVALD
jgi:hypothetical protein